MIKSKRLINNAVVSAFQAVVSGVVLFLLYRYLIAHLGMELLGLWSVILASTAVARMSDLGLTGSVVKFVAKYHSVNMDKQASEIVQTAAISIAIFMAVLLMMVYPLLDDLLALVVPDKFMSEAIQILPFAVLSLWLGSIGGVFQSGLDGCQRMDIRNIIMIIANLGYLLAAMFLVPAYGLQGLAMGQAAQAFLVLLMSWFLLRIRLRTLPIFPIYWSKSKFKEMFSYALNFQINSVAVLLFDSATKFLMAYFGGLTGAAYYEMVNQMIVKLRALLISANQALVPAVAEMHETSPSEVCKLYLTSYKVLFFLVLPFYSIILVSLPVVSELWMGKVDLQFLWFGLILVVGYGVSNLVGPAYFVNLGTGDLMWNSISHVVMAVLNLVFGYTLGLMLGGVGVIIGGMLAMVLSSWLILIPIHKRFVLSADYLYPKEHTKLIIISVFSLLPSLWVLLRGNFVEEGILLNGAVLMGYLVVFFLLLWIHPYKHMILHKILNKKVVEL